MVQSGGEPQGRRCCYVDLQEAALAGPGRAEPRHVYKVEPRDLLMLWMSTERRRWQG